MAKCYFCESEQANCKNTDMDEKSITCPNCGPYIMSGTLLACSEIMREIEKNKHLFAGYLYETNRHSNKSLQFTSQANLFLEDKNIHHTTMQKLEKLLLYFYRNNICIGQTHRIQEYEIISPVAYARGKDEITAMLNSLDKMGWIENFEKDIQGNQEFVLTIQGLVHAEQLISTNIGSTKVFVAMQFNDDLINAHHDAIQPACADCGFQARLVSEHEHNNCITDEIISVIKSSRFVIVDFTYNNAGAYFEAGLAQGLGIPVIRCCKKEWFDGSDESGAKNNLHFDVRHYSTIVWEDHADLKKRLRNNIRANIPGSTLTDSTETNIVNE